jgi:putative Mn2+ efflux pump MntP
LLKKQTLTPLLNSDSIFPFMSFIELFLIALGLSMDAFAVSLCKGLRMQKVNYGHATVIALFFGGFQGLMPLIGWFLGTRFEQLITRYDHWVAFALLGFIGGKMLMEAFKKEEEESCDYSAENNKLDIKELFILAIATSIDALAVGITFAFLQVDIITSVSLIGITTFILALVGVVLGNHFGVKYKQKAEIAGGVILIFIGLKILLSHLGIINF